MDAKKAILHFILIVLIILNVGSVVTGRDIVGNTPLSVEKNSTSFSQGKNDSKVISQFDDPPANPGKILKLRVRGIKQDLTQDTSSEEVCVVMPDVVSRFDGSDIKDPYVSPSTTKSDISEVEAPLLYDVVRSSVDFKGCPVDRSKTGCWKSASFIIGVEMAERFAYYGISSNLVSYLTGPLGQSAAAAAAAANVNVWYGTAFLSPLVGAFIADSYLGKYQTVIIASLLYILGLGFLSLSAALDHSNKARLPPQSQIIFFFCSLFLVALAQGGHKPCLQAFGAEQFDESDEDECKAKSSFFNWWNFCLCASVVVAMKLITRILDPNPLKRITIPEILADEWFKKDFKPPIFDEKEDTNLDDVEAVFKDSEKDYNVKYFTHVYLGTGDRDTRGKQGSANEIINKIEQAAKPLDFGVQKKNYKMRLENLKAGRKGNLNVATEFYKNLSTCLEDVV
ncbi:protein nrt1/ ptr family 5.15 [Phtheirospermum japonicum]|uniref:Protein nrt1/ ptr family 5.15 n=1 Tax=Phtheirospermum japonicum TaxID=374723 RepID=A0A830D8U8_9LAMI|nr:protein nrt1/ ptr family 5.15 [Phtheirospermum japonicum]